MKWGFLGFKTLLLPVQSVAADEERRTLKRAMKLLTSDNPSGAACGSTPRALY